ncbi:SRPBCC family protein [Streptomyces sp. NPDC048650]|uniref:SRPBCC family protein n=1 Tax=unclassified Streptomyces TaxID=2593676 RepID=UPI00372107BB
MPETCASAVIPADPASVWHVVRNFDGLPAWQPGVTHSALGEGDAGDRVGGTRTLRLADRSTVTESLVALDDHRRSLTYEIVESPYPVRSYRSTIRVLPLTTTGESFVLWSLRFDCDARDAERLTASFCDGVLTLGLHGLADHFTRAGD